MSANIIITQSAVSGPAGKSRNDIVVDEVVTVSNTTVETTYLWTLTDVPVRSALARGATGTAATFAFTPDVKGTYRVTLQVNGSTAEVDNTSILCRVLSTGDRALGWPYLAAEEHNNEDNIDYPGLGFPGDTNPRGWATPLDLVFEEIEESAWRTQNSVVISPGPGALNDSLVRLDPATGLFDPSVIPAGVGAASGSSLLSDAGEWSVPSGVLVGQVIYQNAPFSGDVADNSALGTAEPVGVVVAKPTATTATVCYAGHATGLSGLAFGDTYYVGNAGAITNVIPSTGWLTVVGRALSTTELLVNIDRAIEL